LQLEHTFTVPAGVEQAWQVLLDIERVAPCLPGASLDTVDGDQFTGTVKVRLGPISLTYKGKASFVEKDEAAHRAVIDAQGRDSRGNGTASAKVTATLVPDGDQATTVTVLTDLNITGKPAQFGRGVMVDVGNKLIGQFADCLAGKLTGTDALPSADETAPGDSAVPEPEATPAAATPVDSAEPPAVAGPGTAAIAEPAALSGGPAPSVTRPDGLTVSAEPAARHAAPAAEPIDLLSSAGPALVKRLAPIALPALAVLLFVILRRRR
jgi:carbon monoxide dehydrogenase subunit G